jgi:glycosyltransferase involved in cell wall biosynthesis
VAGLAAADQRPSKTLAARVAVVHEWLTTWAGSENVLAEILGCYPEADLFCVVDFLADAERARLGSRRITTSAIQTLPFARTRYRSYLPLMPLAIEQFDLSGYDLVISSSHAVAKGVLTGPDQVHVSYVHSPMRYAWDLQHQYLRESGLERGAKSWAARWMLHRLRLWDVRTANGVDRFVANSRFVARRIRKAYGRDATVVYPPVAVAAFLPCADKDDYYLAASRMVPYKRLDLVVAAFAERADRRLVVAGDGPDMPRLRAMATPNVSFVGHQDRAGLARLLSRARAFLFAAEEDFGILPVEAQACGTPVIAYGRGGALESLRGPETTEPTALFFPEQSATSLLAAVEAFERDPGRFRPEACRRNAERFAPQRFRDELRAVVDAARAATEGR